MGRGIEKAKAENLDAMQARADSLGYGRDKRRDTPCDPARRQEAVLGEPVDNALKGGG